MSLALRMLLMIFSVGFVYFVLKRIHKDQLRIQDSIFWILLSVLVLILAFFPQIAIGMAQQLGIISPVNFVFLVFILPADPAQDSGSHGKCVPSRPANRR